MEASDSSQYVNQNQDVKNLDMAAIITCVVRSYESINRATFHRTCPKFRPLTRVDQRHNPDPTLKSHSLTRDKMSKGYVGNKETERKSMFSKDTIISCQSNIDYLFNYAEVIRRRRKKEKNLK